MGEQAKDGAFVPARIRDREFDFRGDVATALTEASTALAGLNASPPRLHSLEALARQLLRAESLASSRIEGLELSYSRLARAAYRPVGPATAGVDARATEVVGNIAAMERAIELASRPATLTVDDIVDIHATLMRFALDRRIAGHIREKQNWVGKRAYSPRDADYVPPPPEHVRPLVEDLCGFVVRDDLPALAQAAIAHAQFETIHPFWDGNGRVGRCLIPAILRRRGASPRFIAPISLVLAVSPRRYIGGLIDYREGRVDDWVEVFALAARTATACADRLADEIAALQRRWLERAGSPRRGSTARRLIEILPAHPVIDVATAQRTLQVSDVAAGRAMNRLSDAGIVSPIGERRRGRVWEAGALFDLVAAVEANLEAGSIA